jgi:hypothetical protein
VTSDSFLAVMGHTAGGTVFQLNMVHQLTSGDRIVQWYIAGLRAGWSGVRVPTWAGNFSLHHRVQTGSGAHPASYPVGTRISFLEGEADHSPPSSAEAKNVWIYTFTPPIRLHGLVLS